MRDLLIGNTSQLAQYWPNHNTVFTSSRDIDIASVKQEYWNRIYFAFSDGRTWLTGDEHCANFQKANVSCPLQLIEEFQDSCDSIVFYSTTELWNYINGPLNIASLLSIGIESTFQFVETPYILSKERVTSRIFRGQREGRYKKVVVLFPYSFNVPSRKEQGFLFSKIFDSIINKKRIEIGDTYYYRDMLHPKFVVEESLKAVNHQIIGSGRLTFVNDFIRDLYKSFDMAYEDYVTEDLRFKSIRGINWLDSQNCLYPYGDLLSDTVSDLRYSMRK